SGRENKEDKERDSAQDDFSWDKEVESAGIVIHRGATENTFFGAVASLFNYPQIDPPRMRHYTCRFPHPNLDKRSSPCALLERPSGFPAQHRHPAQNRLDSRHHGRG